MMVLIIHELTTNSVKYGALSVKEGKLKISWKLEDKGLLFEWQELNGPSVQEPTALGFGSTIIKNAVEYEFSGKSKMEFRKDGLYASFTLPDSLVGEGKEAISVLEQITNTAVAESTVKRSNINVLILEDDYINAQDMKAVISGPQIKEVNTFSNQQQALDSLERVDYDIALLDVNLKNETSSEVAKKCAASQIPFYYITGYGNDFLEKKIFPTGPVILKPVKTEKLREIIKQHTI